MSAGFVCRLSVGRRLAPGLVSAPVASLEQDARWTKVRVRPAADFITDSERRGLIRMKPGRLTCAGVAAIMMVLPSTLWHGAPPQANVRVVVRVAHPRPVKPVDSIDPVDAERPPIARLTNVEPGLPVQTPVFGLSR